jgi:hypothetical protein
MKKLLLFCLIIPLFLFSKEKPKVERDWFDGHFWVCINGSHWLHDPDCDCNYRYVGWWESHKTPEGDINRIEMFREPITPD